MKLKIIRRPTINEDAYYYLLRKASNGDIDYDELTHYDFGLCEWYDTIDCPRVGYNDSATIWFMKYMARKLVPNANEHMLEYLMEQYNGHPVVAISDYRDYFRISEFEYYDLLMIDADEIRNNDNLIMHAPELCNRVMYMHTPAQMLSYADEIQSIMTERYIIDDILAWFIKWLRFWGEHGHGCVPY